MGAVEQLRARLDRAKAMAEMASFMRGLTDAQRRALARDVAQVLHTCPPGVERFAFLRGLIARLDAGTATYEDKIIADGCRLDVLRAFSRLASAFGEKGPP